METVHFINDNMSYQDYERILNSLNFKLGFKMIYDKANNYYELLHYNKEKNLIIYGNFFDNKLAQSIVFGEVQTDDEKTYLENASKNCLFMKNRDFIFESKNGLEHLMDILKKVNTIPFSNQNRVLPVNYQDFEKLTMELVINGKSTYINQSQITLYKIINSCDEIKKIYNYNCDDKIKDKIIFKNELFEQAIKEKKTVFVFQ